jgi:4-amino-4-deoxy-L-arabinose transferase-like glycosyltransferase
MKIIKSIKHFFSEHKKEVIYFFLIYIFAIIPGMIGFEIARRVFPSEKLLMLLLLVMPTIPVCIFTEYSYSRMGYRKPIISALNTFVVLNFSLILLLNLDNKFLPSSYSIFIIISGLILGGFGYYFVKGDACSCIKN